MFSLDSQIRSIAAASLISLPSLLYAQTGPDLGHEVTSEYLTNWAISIGPDGTGLPQGNGGVEQGADLYRMKCLACHGVSGMGGSNDALAGGGHRDLNGLMPVRTVGSYWPYATTLFDYIRRAMPYNRPQSLSADEVYAITAYILYINGVIGEEQIITEKSLPKVRMPNRKNFSIAYPDKRD